MYDDSLLWLLSSNQLKRSFTTVTLLDIEFIQNQEKISLILYVY
jgi:hypothetical protein